MKPETLRYTKEHEWIGQDGAIWVVGITDYAQKQLGDITYVELPKPGKSFNAGESLAVIESVKVAGDIYAPAGGTVAESNAAVEKSPEIVNQDPYGRGWICKLSGVVSTELDKLMTADQYAVFTSGGRK